MKNNISHRYDNEDLPNNFFVGNRRDTARTSLFLKPYGVCPLYSAPNAGAQPLLTVFVGRQTLTNWYSGPFVRSSRVCSCSLRQYTSRCSTQWSISFPMCYFTRVFNRGPFPGLLDITTPSICTGCFAESVPCFSSELRLYAPHQLNIELSTPQSRRFLSPISRIGLRIAPNGRKRHLTRPQLLNSRTFTVMSTVDYSGKYTLLIVGTVIHSYTQKQVSHLHFLRFSTSSRFWSSFIKPPPPYNIPIL